MSIKTTCDYSLVARKKQHAFNSERYRVFLKKQFVNLQPRYYSVTACREIETVDGPMYAMHIVVNRIEDPSVELIAEVWINRAYVYLWRDHCWTIAVDNNDEYIISRDHTLIDDGSTPAPDDKTIIIHQIGTFRIE